MRDGQVTDSVTQFNAVKEMLGLPEVAEAFQQAGFTTLLYDPRATGLSDGEPRNEIDPFKQVEDVSDAFTFLANHAKVYRDKVGVWGMSLGGATALTAAAFDTRPRFAIAVCPAVCFPFDRQRLSRVLKMITKDRESRAKGNDPLYIPMIDKSGLNPAGFNLGWDRERAIKLMEFFDESTATRSELAPHHVNRTTISSYQKLLMWNPEPIWEHLQSTPTMFVVPELDNMIPADTQASYFERIQSPKRMHIEKGVGHMDVLEGGNTKQLAQLQVDFIQGALEGKLENQQNASTE